MSVKIAVLFDDKNSLSSIFKPCVVSIFEKIEAEWKITEKLSINLNMSDGILKFREGLTNFISQISGVDVIVSSEISGIPYNELDKKGFSICEKSNFSLTLLDEILEAKTNDTDCCKIEITDEVPTYPIATDIDGNYFFDLKMLLLKKSSLTSKQALIPFLTNEKFKSLEVICSHIPPWFDTELSKLNRKYEVLKVSESEFKANIF